MIAMARAAAAGGAVGIRAEGPADVRAISANLALPLIGLWKIGHDGVYITPTVPDAVTIADAGATIVAADATGRPRPGNGTFADIVTALHDRGTLVMADVATVDEGLAAEQAGADVVSTTLAGYTGDIPGIGPALDLVADLASRLTVPLIAEGRIHTPAQARQALAAGAWAVVVGTAITAPAWITKQFAQALTGTNPG
jgi:N-acylglucosamine-6-phosphate 2-epimerase